MKIEILRDEYWWGGKIKHAENMPFDASSEYSIDLATERQTQTAPLFLSSKGRYIWSEEPFIITFKDGCISVESNYEIEINDGGTTLREAYLNAMKDHFPFAEGIHTPREFYQYPQFNTWMELIKNQNQADIIKYAEEVVENGYTPGILMIDGGWQKCQGVWEVNREMMPDPKQMVDRLHELGFNCVGGWSNEYLHDANNPLVYTMITKTLRAYAQQLKTDVSTAGGTQFAKGVSPVFNPSFVDYAKKSLEEQLAPYVNDPNIYGWMSDNELEYNEKALEGFLSLDPSRPENAYLYAMGRTFLYMKTGDTEVSPEDIPAELKKEFVGLIYDRYFDVVSTAMKAVDPNHMYMGSRFVKGCVEKNDYVLKISGLYCDLITYNCYKETAMKSDVIQKIQNLTNRPFIITEFATAGMDACNVEDRVTNAGSVAFIVRTQADRGVSVQSFILKLMECKYCVGYDYYKYRTSDPDSGADLSNLYGSSAFITHRETEYTDFVARISQVNNAKYSLIKFFDDRR